MRSRIMGQRFRINSIAALAAVWLLGGSADSLQAAEDSPPRDAPLKEKKWEELTNQEVSDDGKKALAINPAKWKHAETDNFILHYRRMTEAQKVAREVEYDLWFVAKTLGATKDRYTKKSHVFVFEDEDEWQTFLPQTGMALWATSFAYGDELFLNVRGGPQDGGRFNSNTLAHEATHAVIARLYPRQRWPLWLNEGFAEYMAGASIAARKNQTIKRHQQALKYAELPLARLASVTSYPTSQQEVAQLYQTSERFVRFLMDDLPKDRFTQFLEAMLAEKTLEEAVVEVYADKVNDFEGFKKRYERFGK